ncbi:aminotransferase class III-fold pyridoxal phosphate-dependent enzyme [Mesorhizobium sp. 2RAF21]|uniref:aminotransferase class III-fold pyridoxal phosphate-dependent enzyme n=1 Tax=Mesorhizobium sp. 2RAF21 TaxID=3232995 RepID=UPI003F973765
MTSDLRSRISQSLIRYGANFSDFVAAEARGSFIYDKEGRRVLDFTSGQMSSILGHPHPEIVEKVSRTIASLDHLFSGMLSEPVLALAEACRARFVAKSDFARVSRPIYENEAMRRLELLSMVPKTRFICHRAR